MNKHLLSFCHKSQYLLLLYFLFIAPPANSQSPDSSAQIYITEIMYDPASSNTTIWEYVEIYNADTIAYNLTGSILDDAAGTIFSTANITSGTIAPRSTAVLYNDDNHLDSLYAAWDSTINFIPVSNWGILNNGGDLVGFWSDITAYNNRNFSTSITSVFYDGGGTWPVHDGFGSIELNCELLASCDLYNGSNWQLNNGSIISQAAGENNGINHGSPGVFPNPPPLVFANRLEFLPTVIDTGRINVLFGIRVCATDGMNVQLDYDKDIVLMDDFSTADYTMVSATVLSPLEGCVSYMITPNSAGEIKLHIGNEDFDSLQATIVIEDFSSPAYSVETQEKFTIYPTVVKQSLRIELVEKLSQQTDVFIFDHVGRLVQMDKIERGVLQKTMSVTRLERAWYYLRIGETFLPFFKL